MPLWALYVLDEPVGVVGRECSRSLEPLPKSAIVVIFGDQTSGFDGLGVALLQACILRSAADGEQRHQKGNPYPNNREGLSLGRKPRVWRMDAVSIAGCCVDAMFSAGCP